MPDPVVSHADGVDPEHEALLADSVGLALVAVLDLGVVLRSDGGSPNGHRPRRTDVRSCRKVE